MNQGYFRATWLSLIVILMPYRHRLLLRHCIYRTLAKTAGRPFPSGSHPDLRCQAMILELGVDSECMCEERTTSCH